MIVALATASAPAPARSLSAPHRITSAIPTAGIGTTGVWPLPDGAVLVRRGTAMTVVARSGAVTRRWQLASPDGLPGDLLADVSPSGSVFVARAGGSAVTVHLGSGQLVATLTRLQAGERGPVEQLADLAADDRGGFLVATTAGGPARARFSADGDFESFEMLPLGRLAVSWSGARLVATPGAVEDVSRLGEWIGTIGIACDGSGGSGGNGAFCPSRHGFFGSTVPLVGHATRGLVLTSNGVDLALSTPSFGPAVVCPDLLRGRPIDAVAMSGSSTVTLLSGQDLYRTDVVPRTTARCAGTGNLGRVRLTRSPISPARPARMSYSLSRASSVRVVLRRYAVSRCDEPVEAGRSCHELAAVAVRPAPGRAGSHRLDIRRCDSHAFCLQAGSWYAQVQAVDRRGRAAVSAFVPLIVR